MKKLLVTAICLFSFTGLAMAQDVPKLQCGPADVVLPQAKEHGFQPIWSGSAGAVALMLYQDADHHWIQIMVGESKDGQTVACKVTSGSDSTLTNQKQDENKS
jgi:hypothetical protein